MTRRAAAAPARAALLAALVCTLAAVPSRAANPSMSRDFARMMEWLSHEMAQGLAFNAGSTFDPPHELKSRRLQPDLSVGAGKMPLDKASFPEPEVPALREMGAANIFPSAVVFPNLAMHLRAGLPWRMDMSIRLANMTTPPGYKLSGNVPAKGQSNSVGFGLRRHFLGQGDLPLLGFGVNFNHVSGRFNLKTKFNVNNVQGFTADSDVNGDFAWSVNSIGTHLTASKDFGAWTPFLGVGYNHSNGSVSTELKAEPNTPLIQPIVGKASEKPELHSARMMTGLQWNASWVNVFANGEIKTVGEHSGKTWVAHIGFTLPFEFNYKGVYSTTKKRKKASSEMDLEARTEEAKPRRRRQAAPAPWQAPSSDDKTPELIFIQ